jgi:uncharacterized membrane-anchored protein
MTKTLLLLFCLGFSVNLFAGGPEDTIQTLSKEMTYEQIEQNLHYKTGKIELTGGIANINVPAGFKFLATKEAKFVIEDLWGNPASAEAPLGLLFPATSGATDTGGYAFIVKFEAMGYVKDHDADKIDYDDLLKELKEGSAKDNIERKKAGLITLDLLGWASRPYYDKAQKVLHWAKEYSVEGSDVHTLNYDVRILGRKGVLNLQAVSAMNELDSVNAHINDVLAMVSFNDGHRYQDYDSSVDEVAAWTIGGLVAGKVLAKVGFFALILKNIKLVLLAIVGAGGAIWRFITGRRKKEDMEYQPQSLPDNNDHTNLPS